MLKKTTKPKRKKPATSGAPRKAKPLPFRLWPKERKKKRIDYLRERREKITAAARKAGVIGKPRTVKYKNEEERAEARKVYNKRYRQRLLEDARSYRNLGIGRKPKPKKS
jgi:hypothetical protein